MTAAHQRLKIVKKVSVLEMQRIDRPCLYFIFTNRNTSIRRSVVYIVDYTQAGVTPDIIHKISMTARGKESGDA